MPVTKITYGTSTSITIGLINLADSSTAGVESTAIDNTTNLYDDAMVTVIITLTTGTPGHDQCAYVWAYGSEDGTNFEDTVTGTSAAITLTVPTQLRLLGVIAMPTQSLAYKKVFGSIATAFGGVLPRKWGIVVRNYSNIAHAASGCSATYTGITYTTA